MQETTIAAIATAPGAGGIAVVRLSGAESYPIAARVFRPVNAAKKVEDAKGYTAMYGTFREGDEAFDEGVALFFRAPHSYTGEDVVEFSCHGGLYLTRRVLRAVLDGGASPAGPGEFTRRAFLNGKMGLTEAEAVMDMIGAKGQLQGDMFDGAGFVRGVLRKGLTLQGARALVVQDLQGLPLTVDNGQHILDVKGLSITDPLAFESEINQWPGVVTVGVFAHQKAHVCLLGTAQGVRTLQF